MSHFMIDVESDGPVPHLYSMVSFGAVRFDHTGSKETFYRQVKPVSDKWIPEALAVSGFTREQTLVHPFVHPTQAMGDFARWIEKVNTKGRPVFYSDNNGYDWQFINYYFHAYHGSNPFGFSSRRIADIIAGLEYDTGVKWKQFRKTSHTHNPVDDCKGNVEAYLHFMEKHDVGL